MTEDLYNLGLFERLVLFKIRRRDSETGFSQVVAPRLNVNFLSAFLSLYYPGRWGRAVRNANLVHLMSPHFFHLVKENPRITGTIHDLIFLDRSTHNRHDTPPGARFFFPRVLKFAERLEGVVVVSEVTNTAVKMRYPRAQTTVIHNWTGDQFRPRDRKQCRELLGLPSDKPILLQVSLDNMRKNLEILPRIMARLPSDYHLVRIGDSRRIHSKMPSGRFLPRESVPPQDYPLYFNAADALLMPSRAEGFGIPIAEAINSGIPAVCSDIEIFREVLRAPYPFLADPDDPERWAERICESVEHGKSDLNCSKLYSRIGEYYRAPRAAAAFRSFFRSLNRGLMPEQGP